MKNKKVSFCIKHIRKLRDELHQKNNIIKAAYDDLINKNFTDSSKISYAGQILAVELRRQSGLDKKLFESLNQLFIDEGEDPPFLLDPQQEKL